MAQAMMRERMPMMVSGMPSMSAGAMPGMGAMPGSMPGSMVPLCKMKMEHCKGGMKMHCLSDDAMSASMMQNLCKMLSWGMCSCSCMMNGMCVGTCNLMMGKCACEMADKGVTITCMSGDADCAKCIQACCDSMNAMMKAGCMCCIMLNGMPVCCGVC